MPTHCESFPEEASNLPRSLINLAHKSQLSRNWETFLRPLQNLGRLYKKETLKVWEQGMKFEELEITTEKQDVRQEIEQIVEEASSLAVFLKRWLRKGDICCGTGIDDYGNHTLVHFGLALENKTVANLYLSRKRVLEAYPKAAAISTYMDENGKLNETRLDRNISGFEYNEELAGALGPFESAMALAMSYALDYIGECSFKAPADYHLEDIDFEGAGLDPDNIRWCNCHFQDPKKGYGFGEHCAFRLDS